jgi:uroporphyrinogen-III synthase
MPITGVIVRFESAASRPDPASLRGLTHVAIGSDTASACSAVVEAPDYAAHDAALAALGALPGVCAVDIVVHDFSDVTEFDGQPRGRRFRDKEPHGTP